MYQRHFPRLCLLLILALCATAAPRAEEEFLLPEEAFPVVVVAEGPNTLVLNWSVAEGYYLYRNKFKFRSLTEGIRTGEPRLPAGEKRQDEFFGEVEILRGPVGVRLPIERATGEGRRLSLEVSSQGCADAGLCYPPHRQTLALDLPPLASDDGAVDKTKPLASSNKSALTQSLGLTAPTEDQALLPAEEAFRLAAEVVGPDRLRLTWIIAEGTYIYQDKLALGLEGPAGISIGDYQLPPAEQVKNAVRPDGSLGEVALYRDRIDLELPIQRGDTEATTITLVAKFQGCADIGVCYPPRQERIELALPAATGAALTAVAPGGEPQTAPAARLAKADLAASPVSTAPATPPPTATGPSPQPSAPVSEQDRIAATLASGNVWAALALFFGFGLLLALTPCVFPMIPILSGIIAGHGPGLSTRKAFWMSLTYVLAMSLTYAIAGLLAGLGGANLQAAFQDPWILSLFALVFVALALSMFGFYDLQLPSSLQTRIAAFSQRQQGGHLIGVAIMGVLSALIVGPCVAPPLAGALIFISQSGDALLGFAALFAMGLGMGAPLLAIGTSAGKLLPRAGAWMEAVKAVFGVALLGVAILLLERLLAPSVAMLLWGALLICSATYMGALHHLPPEAGGWRKLWKGLGLVTLVYGALMLVGAAAGGKDTLQPLRGLGFGPGGTSPGAVPHASFKAIKGVADLEREIAAAQASGRPVLLDFYADWCVSCKEMERYTFSDPAVAAEMARFVLLQADVTANDEEDQALMQGRFGIPGPPAILFFDPQGQERRDRRLVGFMPAAEFASHLQGLRP
ncbi:MAG: protein-disulfide reductase DsbD [Chromatiaceae bacterium]|nr:protein-disulfide reductase DsbD [Chromatiaceae bacterium]